MSIGLDIGVGRLRSLRRSGDRLSARRCRAEYLILDDAESTRKLLDQVQVSYACCDDSLMLMGDAATEFAEVLGTSARPLFPSGRIPRDDPPVRQVLGALIASLLPTPVEPNEVCCLTIPGNPSDGEGVFGREYEFLTRLVSLQGYSPAVLNSSMALILAELADESFTGVGFDFGAGSCDVVLSHRGRLISQISIPAGGDWLNMELAKQAESFTWDRAGHRSFDLQSAANWKQSLAGSLIQPANDREQFLAELVRELIVHVIGETAQELALALKTNGVPSSVAVVVGGGTAKLPGFCAMFEQAWLDSRFPLQAHLFRLAVDSEYSVARGCLIRAELESPAQSGERMAA